MALQNFILKTCKNNSANKLIQRYYSPTAAKVQENINSEIANQTEWDAALPFEKIPGPSKFEIFRSFALGGEFYQMDRDKIAKILRNRYGDIFKIPGTGKRPNMIYLFNPADFEKVYRNDGIWPSRRALDTLLHYRHELNSDFYNETGTLITTNGELWGKFRSIVNPIMMQPKTVRVYLPQMDKITNKFIDRCRQIRDPKTNELPGNYEEELNNWALQQIALVGLDTDLNLIGNNNINEDVKKLVNAINIIFQKSADLEFNPTLWRFFATKKFKEVIEAFETLEKISLKYVNEAVERYKKIENDDRNENEKSIVERLIKINPKIALITAIELFFAGIDTTTTTFAGCMLALSQSPEKQEKLRQEVKKILPNPNDIITEEKLKHFSYLRAVVKETLRLYPIVHENQRFATINFVIGNYRIPKGTDIIMHGTHHYMNEEHFTDADKFLPERWLRNQDEECPFSVKKTAHPFVYLPFGFGPRMCVGKRLVDMELEVLLARMVRNFHIEYNYEDKNLFGLKLIYRPIKELKFTLKDIKE